MNEKQMPARIWIDEALGMVGYINEPPPPESDFRYEYVPADLLATARKEAFKEAAEKVHAMSRIDAKDKSRDFLAGAAWLQNKAALMLAKLSVEAATTDTDKQERG